MDPLTAHHTTQDVFAAVLAEVTPDQLDRPTPCSDWDANAVIQHVIGGNQLGVLMVAGLEVPELPDGTAPSSRARRRRRPPTSSPPSSDERSAEPGLTSASTGRRAGAR